MIVQACINGARPPAFHPALPLTVEAMARDACACVDVGAAEIHCHPRDADGRESLAAVDAAVRSLRHVCPGTLIGVSTGAWIEGGPDRTRATIRAWQDCPDYASVNLSEPDAPEVLAELRRRGVGIEAGLATAADAERLLDDAANGTVFRVLIEIEQQATAPAEALAREIAAILDKGGMRRPILLHGFDTTVWTFVTMARRHRWSTRIGLEDGCVLPDGQVAADNAALVSAAVALFRG